MALEAGVWRDLQLQAGYTLARSIDPNAGGTGNGGDLNNVTNPYVGWRYDIGPSAYDRTNVFFANFGYQLPFLKNSDHAALRMGLGGWDLSGIVAAESGAPLNLGVSGNTAASVITFAGGDRPDRSGRSQGIPTGSIASVLADTGDPAASGYPTFVDVLKVGVA